MPPPVVTGDPLAVLGLGFVLGLRHALDVDHLAAVSTLASRRRGVLGSSLVGALWGLGHTLALLAVGVVVIALQTHVPTGLARGLELGVAAMLVGLGLQVLWTIRGGGRLHVHVHEHDGRRHVHAHVHRGDPPGGPDHHHVPRGRPLLVGVVHGLAGGAAVMLAALAAIPSPPLAMAYLGVFGLGSIGGMVAMSALLGVPLALVGRRSHRAAVAIRAAAGAGSIAVGLGLAWRIGIEAGLLA